MATYTVYVLYDFRLDKFHDDMLFSDELAARKEFAMRVNVITKDWEKREFERYFLFALGERVDGVYARFNRPRFVMDDREVNFDYERFFNADPPHDKAAEAAIDVEFERIVLLDSERLSAYEAAKPRKRGVA